MGSFSATQSCVSESSAARKHIACYFMSKYVRRSLWSQLSVFPAENELVKVAVEGWVSETIVTNWKGQVLQFHDVIMSLEAEKNK